MAVDRRSFLKFLSSAALAATFPESIAKALSIGPSRHTGTIADVEHIVILMQENRSFDHYFGTLSGVRGFGDPRVVSLPSGKPVWYQPDTDGGYTLPFHPTAPNLGLQFLGDLAHDWKTTHDAWNEGNYDRWVPTKGNLTMAHLTRADIPFHYALADAFTVCDAYHSSLMGSTYPNRLHMWSGWVGNDGLQGGPALDNSSGYSWSTFPEQLEKAGISWRIYQDQGHGLDVSNNWGNDADPYIGNYGCNTLLRFDQYQDAAPGTPLFESARTATNALDSGTLDTLFDLFRQDVLANRLPQVSWIVAPEAFTEHPNWPADYGAWYVSQILDALTANPEVWSKTVFLLTYDENDGFFDHVVPPTPPQSRAQGLSNVALTHEIFTGNSEFSAGPYGLGMRVPMIVISPWSKGGWVNSEVFDHTSMIRFIQARFGQGSAELSDTNITPWRSAVTGDLTSALQFANPSVGATSLPSTTSYAPLDRTRHPDYRPAPPEKQALPLQEPGTRLACGLAYSINCSGVPDFNTRTFNISLINTGSRAAVFQVRSGNTSRGPWTYTVESNAKTTDSWKLADDGGEAYDLCVYGPNGFFRAFKGGSDSKTSVYLRSTLVYNILEGGVTLQLQNVGFGPCKLRIQNLYNNDIVTQLLNAGQVFEQFWQLEEFFGWYSLVMTVESDAAFRYQFAGHLETGKHSRTDPAIGMTKGFFI